MSAVLTGKVTIPRRCLTDAEREKIRRELTWTRDEVTEISTYAESEDGRSVHLPVSYGVKVCQRLGLAIDDESSVGEFEWSPATYPDPMHPDAPKGQPAFFKDLLAAVMRQHAVMAMADTGTGKTAAGLYVAGMLGRPFLVIVPRKEIALQWAESAKRFLGLSDGDIAVASGSDIDYVGKAMVVMVVNTLGMKAPRKRFSRYFGLVIWDECFPAGTRVGEKRIEEIKVGDMVNSVNHMTGEMELKKVNRVWRRPLRHKMVRIRFESGVRIVCTENHLFWTVEDGYIKAKDLRLGHGAAKLSDAHINEVLEVDRVESIESLQRGGDGKYGEHCPEGHVYDLEVEDNHNFFANGILVHNCHVLGAQVFARSMGRIDAAYRLALTATPDRGDRMERVFYSYFGKPSVIAAMPALPLVYLSVPYHGGFQYPPAMPAPLLLNALAKDARRNELIVRLVLMAYRKERGIIVMSDRIEQLQRLQSLTVNGGVPEELTGLYIGKARPAELKAMRENCRILFATYPLAGTGTDIPWLDTGVMATPRARVRQSAGRIRRKENAKGAVWVSIDDDSHYLLRRHAESRRKEIAKSENVTFETYHA